MSEERPTYRAGVNDGYEMGTHAERTRISLAQSHDIGFAIGVLEGVKMSHGKYRPEAIDEALVGLRRAGDSLWPITEAAP